MKSEIESPAPPPPAATSKPKKRKSSPEPPKLSRDERFYELFKTALQGLCAQFEDAGNPRYAEGKAELERASTCCAGHGISRLTPPQCSRMTKSIRSTRR